MLSDELEMQAMTLSIAGENNSVCMTKEDCTFIYSIVIDDVKLTVNKLKFGKSGGSSGIMSDCYVHGTDILYHYIALLYKGVYSTQTHLFFVIEILFTIYIKICVPIVN